MTEGEFPFRSFTMREQGYDREEVDSYVEELRGEIVELRRALDAAVPTGDAADARLHDPEGAVVRTLAIAQETADRVLHDAQVEADRRRTEAETHATSTIADADERAARLLGDMEAQAAEVREQGIAAARSAIQVERDKAMAELSHVRRVRDDLRTEAVELKSSLDRYRSQAREASDTLAAASSGPLMSLDLPDLIDDDVVLAGIVDDATASSVADAESAGAIEITRGPAPIYNPDAMDTADAELTELDNDGDGDDDDAAESHLFAVDGEEDRLDDDDDGSEDEAGELADVIAIDSDSAAEDVTIDLAGDDDGGTFLAEVRAAAEDDDVSLPPENESDDGGDSDLFLSELRGLTSDGNDLIDSEAADTFFDD